MISLSVEVKNIDVGTLLAFQFFSFSDGVLCFRHIFCVFFLVWSICKYACAHIMDA